MKLATIMVSFVLLAPALCWGGKFDGLVGAVVRHTRAPLVSSPMINRTPLASSSITRHTRTPLITSPLTERSYGFRRFHGTTVVRSRQESVDAITSEETMEEVMLAREESLIAYLEHQRYASSHQVKDETEQTSSTSLQLQNSQDSNTLMTLKQENEKLKKQLHSSERKLSSANTGKGIRTGIILMLLLGMF